MNVLLISPPSDHYSETHRGFYPPFGLLAVGTSLIKRGFAVKIIDMNNGDETNLEKLLPITDDFEVVGISCNLDNFPITKEIITAIKNRSPDCLVIVGGPFPTVAPEFYLEHTEADYVVQGEGENISLETIPLDSKRILRRIGTVENLDRYTPWNYSLIELEKYINQPVKDLPSPCASIITARGCPFNCSFCASQYLGRSCRARSIDSVRAEIEWLIEKYKIQGLQFLDPTFTSQIRRTLKLCEMLKPYGLKWSCMTRVDCLDEELVKAMSAAGCVRVWLGLESFSQDVLSKGKKKTTVKANIKAIKLLKKHSIIAGGFILLGLPGQTLESLQITWEAIQHLEIGITPNMLHPIPGTAIYKEAQKRTDFPSLLELAMEVFPRYNSSNRTAGYNLSDVPDKEIVKFIQKAWRNNK